MRRAAKADGTQPAIVEALRKVGVAVLHLHQVGKGCPDLLAWNRGRYVLVECKVPGRDLNKEQIEFVATWPGEIIIARSPEEAVKAVLGEAHG